MPLWIVHCKSRTVFTGTSLRSVHHPTKAKLPCYHACQKSSPGIIVAGCLDAIAVLLRSFRGFITTVLFMLFTTCKFRYMPPWYGNIFRITDPLLWTQSTGHWWIPLTQGLGMRAYIFSLLFAWSFIAGVWDTWPAWCHANGIIMIKLVWSSHRVTDAMSGTYVGLKHCVLYAW